MLFYAMIDHSYLLIFVFLLLLHHLYPMETSTNTNDESFHQQIPFFVMQPHTVINQTLHSYCKEQIEFNDQPMFVNLTEWPSGFIYAQNPYEYSNLINDYEMKMISFEECTMELRAAIGHRIRMVFYPIETIVDDYDQDYGPPTSKTPCLKIRDIDETVIVDCPLLYDRRKSNRYHYDHQSEDHLSNSHVIYLELIPPSLTINEHQGILYHQFKLFFTLFTPKTNRLCPDEHLIDCDDTFCVHSNARCNGINDCRSKLDEESCSIRTSIIGRAHSNKSTSLLIFILFNRILSLF